MKRKINKVIAALLIMALVFTSWELVFATDDEGGRNARIKPTTQNGQISFKVISTIYEKNRTYPDKDAWVASYNHEEPNPGKIVQAQTIGKGVVEFHLYNHKGNTSDMEFGIYQDAGLSTPVISGQGLVSPGRHKNLFINISEAGLYYLGVKSNDPIAAQQTFGSVAYFYDGTDRTLDNKKKGIVVGCALPQINLFKFKAAYTGFLYVNIFNAEGKMTLLNANKKNLSNDVVLRHHDWDTYFGVKKGKTYYIKAICKKTSGMIGNNTGTNPTVDIFCVYPHNTKIKEKSGNKKSKAVTIKEKKNVKGTITAGISRADWYKFKLTSKKRLKITVDGDSNKKIKVYIYNPKGKIVKKSKTYIKNDKGFTLNIKNAQKGTYYIKVFRADKYSSGYYTIKWLTK